MRISTGRSIAFVLGIALVVGSTGFLLQAEPPQEVGTWASIGTTDPQATRTGAAVATLPDRTTLVAGGLTAEGAATDSIVIHDPLTNSSTQVGQLLVARVNASATRLDDGRVLITGGDVGGIISSDVEIFNPATGESTFAALLQQPRTGHASALLADGTVLIVGGTTVDDVVLATTERFDPSTNSVTAAEPMAVARTGASATTLIDGRVLVAGGRDGGAQDLKSAEIYSPVDGEFLSVPTQMSEARSGHSAVLLPHNNAVLIAGGTAADTTVTTTDLFLPAMFPDPYSWGMGTFGPTDPEELARMTMVQPRSRAVAGPWGDDGYAFAMGGGSGDGEVYRFATIKADKDDYEPGELAVITGSGWAPLEEVTLTFQEDPAVHDDYVLTLTADDEGNIYHDQWAPEEHDLNVRFYLMAIGNVSQRRAQMTFTDARNLDLTFAGNGSGSVTITPSTGTVNAPVACGGTNTNAASQTVTATCSPNISTSDNGATVTFSAVGTGGSTFTGWSGQSNLSSSSCTGTTTPCSAVLGSGPALTATFTAPNATVTPAAGGGAISAATAGGAYTTLTGPVIGENGTGQIGVGTITLNAPTGFIFDIGGSTPTVLVTRTAGSGLNTLNINDQPSGTSAAITLRTTTTITFTVIPGGVTSAGVRNSLTWQNVRVRPTAGTPLASGNITKSGTSSIAGVTGTTNFGTLTEVPGPASKLAFAQQPTTTVLGQTISPAVTVRVEDVAGNLISTDTRSITLVIGNNPGASTLGGTTSSAAVGGVATFGTLSLNHAGTGYTLAASSSPALTGATSSAFNITQASQTITFGALANKTYGDLDFAVSATASSGLAVSFSSQTPLVCTVVGTTVHIVASGSCTIRASQAGNADYTAAPNVDQAFTIGKATAVVVVTPYDVTYDGLPHTALVASITGVNGETGATVGTVDVSNTTHTAAGTYAGDSWSFTGTANYNDIAATPITNEIDKANATFTVTGYDVTYDGLPHTATVSTITGVNGETGATVGTVDVSATTHTNAGSYPGDAWTFTGTANYNNANGTVDSEIDKANATFTVTGYDVTYDGLPHTATVSTITGVNGETGATVGTVDVSGTTHTDAGTYNDTWSFTGTANYNDIAATPITNEIDKADALVTVSGTTVTYDTAAHGATGTATGVGSVDLSAGLSLGATFTDVPGGTANWTFEGGTNYLDESGSVEIVINQAVATVTVTGYTGPYDATPHGATGTATGLGDVDLSTGLSLGASFTNVPGGTANWTFEGGTNYTDQTGTAAIVINQAVATVTVNGYTGTYDAAAHGATGSATGVDAGGAALGGTLDLGASFTNVPGGTATWTFEGGTNYTDQTGTAAIVINQAVATVTVNGYTGTYDAAAHGATGSATGVDAGGVALGSTLDLGASFTNVPGGTANWTFEGGTNYTDQTGTAAIVINQAVATVTVNGYTGTYDAAAHGATGSATGVDAGGAALGSTLDLGASFTNVPGGTATWTFEGGTNYTDQTGTAAIVINQAVATVTVNGYSGTYDAAAHGATGSATGVDAGGAALGGTLDLGASFTNVPGGTATWTFEGGTNYTDQTGTAAIVINQAVATVTVNGYTGTYDAAAHGATGSATGVDAGGAALGGTLDLGASFTNVPGGTATWTFEGGTNYTDQTGTAAIVINQAVATVTVNGYTGTYDAAAHGATGSATGVDAGGAALGSTLDLGASFTNVPGGTATWTFEGGTNYTDQTGTAAITITQADANVTITPYSGTYDAAEHNLTGSVVGVAGDLAAAGSSLTFGAGFTNVPGGTGTWTFEGGTNYLDESGTAAITITQADASVTITPYSGTYDAAEHNLTGTVTGVAGDLAAAGSSLTFGAGFTNVPGGTGTWTFEGGTNYVDETGTAAITITQADANVTITPYSGTYDAAEHNLSGTVAGVAGDLAAAGSSLTFGAGFTNVPGGTGAWTFEGGTNYLDESGSAAITITQADATVSITPYSGTYDAAEHNLSGTVAGVAGDLAAAGSSLTFGAGFTNVPGGTGTWTFEGGTNYLDESGSAAITITQADATVSITPYSGTYDAAAHNLSGTVTGVAGDPSAAGSSLTFGASFTNVPGGTGTWTFEGGTNYLDESGSAAITITQADATVSITPYSGIYDAAAHNLSGTVTGVAGDPSAAGSSLTFGASFTNVPGGTGTWTFEGGTNYLDESGSAAIDITQADANVTITPYSGTYDAAAHNLTGSVAGVVGDPTAVGSSLTFGTSITDAPGGTGTWAFEGGTNYLDESGTAPITIAQADANCTVNGYTGIYNGAAHGASGSCVGVPGDPTAAGSTLNLGATFTDVPGGTANWTFEGGTNYLDESANVAIVINKKTLTVSGITANNKPFDGNTTATLNLGTAALVGVVVYPPDVVTLNTAGATGIFASSAVGTHVVTIDGLTIGGDDVGNYSLIQPTTTASITAWKLSGYLQPVGIANTYPGMPLVASNTIWNTIKGGQTVPLKFEIFTSAGGTELTSVSNVSGFTLVSLLCTPGAEDVVEVVATPGSTTLGYDGSQFHLNWQTPKGANKCYRMTMTASDGSQLTAFFKSK